ncbi:hypothetical protein [Rubricoccus marinus]|uniref:hypothetical protein n=1 Tax=Rubricoccus marinus TaxID=716817 RepID=UPI00117B68CA|nr:hypothetical protein [Rubricoccus marinus]
MTLDPVGGQPRKYSFAFLFLYGLFIRTGEFSLLKLVLLASGVSSAALVAAPFFVWRSQSKGRLLWFCVALAALTATVSVALLMRAETLFSGYYVLLLGLLVTAIACGLLWRRALSAAV